MTVASISSVHRPTDGSRGVPPPAAWLGLAGLIPFAAGAVGAWLMPAPWALLATDGLVGYGAVILSFLGAVHWGLAMGRADGGAERPAVRWLALSVLPALVGWGALLLPAATGLVTLAVAFVAVYGLDRVAIRAGRAPLWYGRLRAPLSAAVVVLLAGGALAAALRTP